MLTDAQVLPLFHLWTACIQPKFVRYVKDGKSTKKKPSINEGRDDLFILVPVSIHLLSIILIGFADATMYIHIRAQCQSELKKKITFSTDLYAHFRNLIFLHLTL